MEDNTDQDLDPESAVPVPAMSARARQQRIQTKLASLNRTYAAVQNLNGVSLPTLNKALLLKAEIDAVGAEVSARWAQLTGASSAAQARVNEAQRELQAAPRKSPDDVKAAQERLEAATREKAEADAAMKATLEAPDDALDRIEPKVDSLIVVAQGVHRDASSEGSLATAGVQTVDANRDEFERGLAYHRRQALWLLVVMLALAGAGVLAVCLIFGDANNLAKLAIHHAPEAGAEISDPEVWLGGLLMLGGRFAVLVGIGWLMVFSGRLHSRHAQQAVSYQERLAGLDAARMVIHYGSARVREQLLQRLTTTYLSTEGNAFRPAQRPPKGASKKEVSGVIATLESAISSLTGTGRKKTNG